MMHGPHIANWRFFDTALAADELAPLAAAILGPVVSSVTQSTVCSLMNLSKATLSSIPPPIQPW